MMWVCDLQEESWSKKLHGMNSEYTISQSNHGGRNEVESNQTYRKSNRVNCRYMDEEYGLNSICFY